MEKNSVPTNTTPSELRDLIKWAVACLGGVIENKLGHKTYVATEALRLKMVALRGQSDSVVFEKLSQTLSELRKLSPVQRIDLARAYTLMLELINVCENAYRSYRLAQHSVGPESSTTSVRQADTIIYVLTAHPTEARSPENIEVFHAIQKILVEALHLKGARERLSATLRHELQIAWQVSAVRTKAPHVSDEAAHIYSILFAEGTIESLLEASQNVVPVYIRTWVGGDKDGHPGVDQTVMHESLSLARSHLVHYVRNSLTRVQATLSLLPKHPLRLQLAGVMKHLGPLMQIKTGDGKRVADFRVRVHDFIELYVKTIGAVHPVLTRLKQLLHVFPGLVVPLELRESSDVLMATPKGHSALAIDLMLKRLGLIARGGDPRWYARGFIVSMTEKIEHLKVAHFKVKAALGSNGIPVIPLFEQAGALANSVTIARQMIHDPHIGKSIKKEWNGILELMVGYSDSSKESGVLPSRLAIATAMNQLDLACTQEKIKVIFFQGSGGSVDRGGGTVQDQTAWWPRSALEVYKVTIQGEMVERSLASADITRGQIERIAQSISYSLAHIAVAPQNSSVEKLSQRVAESYRKVIQDPEFLQVVAKATPYSDLSELKLGSRPTSRSKEISVAGLRAIPWVLCWTQTRVLFQTWWGIGTAWKTMDTSDRVALREAFKTEPVFSSFVRALGFTLAKVELGVWRLYLAQSGLSEKTIQKFVTQFDDECRLTHEFFEFVTGTSNLLWYRPWLGSSIRLRSAMIHPLNMLQILAIEDRDFNLLRYTVTGISSGMMTTG